MIDTSAVERAFRYLIYIVIISVPLALWKIIEIILWFIS